jgi:hypothetical protein
MQLCTSLPHHHLPAYLLPLLFIYPLLSCTLGNNQQTSGQPAPAKKEVVSGLKHLSEEARVRATDKKASKFEKV